MVIGFDIQTSATPSGTLALNKTHNAAAMIICQGTGINEQNIPMNVARATLRLFK